MRTSHNDNTSNKQITIRQQQQQNSDDDDDNDDDDNDNDEASEPTKKQNNMKNTRLNEGRSAQTRAGPNEKRREVNRTEQINKEITIRQHARTH